MCTNNGEVWYNEMYLFSKMGLYHLDVTCFIISLLNVQHVSVSGLKPGHYSSLTAPNLQHTANQERNDQCGNQHHCRELLVMGIVMPETC